MHANSVLPIIEEPEDGSYRPAVYPSTRDRSRKTAGIPVRVIENELLSQMCDGEKINGFLDEHLPAGPRDGPG